MRRKRIELRFFRNNFAPLHLFLAGLFIIPAFVFQGDPYIKLVQTMAFALLAVLAGKRVNFLYFGSLVLVIAVFNLFLPWGKVLFTVGPLRVTQGALENGLAKGITICGLVFISLFTIRPALRIPGRLGALVAKMFLYFDRILEGKKSINPKHLIESLDRVLSDLYLPGMRTTVQSGPVFRTTYKGVVFIAALLILNYGILLVR